MKKIKNYKLFKESINSFKDSIKLNQNSKYKTEYLFNDDLNNIFLVSFEEKSSNNHKVSYYTWDKNINDWSVSKMVKSNPWKIIKTIFNHILEEFLSIKPDCKRIEFEGLSKEVEKDYISQRTKVYRRFLERNTPKYFTIKSYGNIIILERI